MTSLISNRDYYLILDKSGSMTEEDTSVPGQNRWEAAEESTLALTRRICRLDNDGITVYAFSRTFRRYDDVKDAAIVKNIFLENEPFGGTNLAPVLRDAFEDYFQNKSKGQSENKGATVLVITDGAPDSQKDVVKEIISATKRMTDPREIGISFIQIGHDNRATRFLQYLDDNLQSEGALHDIVDTIKIDTIEEIGLTQALINAIID